MGQRPLDILADIVADLIIVIIFSIIGYAIYLAFGQCKFVRDILGLAIFASINIPAWLIYFAFLYYDIRKRS